MSKTKCQLFVQSWAHCHANNKRGQTWNENKKNRIFLKSLKRSETELFRQLSWQILALSGAEIWSFWCTKSGIFGILAKTDKTKFLGSHVPYLGSGQG